MLSPSVNDTLLLHSLVLKKFPRFEAQLSNRWSPVVDEADHPSVRKFQVWTYGLVFHEEGDAFSLKGGVSSSNLSLLG